jgi:hypothetical protein
VRRLALVIALAAPGLAAAAPDLEVHAVIPPLPRSLDMRPVAPAIAVEPEVSGSQPEANRTGPSTEEEEAQLGETLRERLEASRQSELLPQLSEKIIFNLALGFGLDGGAESGRVRLSGSPLIEGRAYDAVRSYGFGDVVVGSNGLGASSLSSFFASSFRFNTGNAASYSIPNYYDNEDIPKVVPRSAYGEIEGFLEHPLLAPLRIRLGRQFHYGPAIAHFTGLTLAYETKLFELKLFSGLRVSNFGFDQANTIAESGTLTGSSARLNLQYLLKVPLVLYGDLLRYDELSHIDTRLAYQFNRNNSVLARARIFNGKVGRQSLLLRSRLSKVTTIASELTRRTRNDFIYDILLTTPIEGDATDARRYLSFGAVRPRLLFNLRAGTVLLRNIDLLVRGGFAIDTTQTDIQPRSSYGVGYAEVGGAFEVRLRRSVRLGTSLLARRYRRRDSNTDATIDAMPEPLLPDTGSVGEKNFLEGGISVRYSTGARKFTARAEVYGRQYAFRSPYDSELENDPDNRSGGRFSVEGWAGSRVRIRAEYDVARLPELMAIELQRVQTLRVLTEGRF